MKFEEVLEDVNSFGCYQKLLCFVLIPLTTGLVGFTYYVQLFILSSPKHLCDPIIKEEFSNSAASENYTDLLFSSLKFHNSKDELSCVQITSESYESLLNSTLESNGVTSLISDQKCVNGWVYHQDSLFPTITSENNWVCEDSWRPYVIVSSFWVGNVFGAWTFGALSDRLGRRPTVAASVFVYGVAGLVSTFVTSNFYLFLILRFFVGFCHHTVSHLAFVLVVEYCGVKSRVIPLLTIMMTYTIASILAPLLAWLIWDWKLILILTSVPNIVILIFYRYLPESPSWMITKKKLKRAAEQLEYVGNVNKSPIEKKELLLKLTNIISEKSEVSPEEKYDDATSPSLMNILKFPKLRRNIMVVLLIWMIGCLCYYGHCQNTSNIGSDIFKNFILGATLEIPAWSVPFLIEKFGRKRPLSLFFLLSGLSGGICVFLPTVYATTILIFALFGRLFITGAYYISLQYCPEIFPTVIRGRGVAMAETFGGIAIFVSPIIVYLIEYHPGLPMMILSCLAIFGGVITVILPETKGKSLPQTLQEGEAFSSTVNVPPEVKRENQTL
ncbi:UNVERIFIED_CONTAM: hypothetical protein RMT77_012260 [Armadillidium vulgare]